MTKPICTVMVGLPGLGKSTIVNFGLGVYDRIEMPVFVYSTDRFIEDAATHFGVSKCQKCGMEFKGITNYYCPTYECPMFSFRS